MALGTYIYASELIHRALKVELNLNDEFKCLKLNLA